MSSDSDYTPDGNGDITYRALNVENFFWLNPNRDSVFFDESPQNLIVAKIKSTSSIDTTQIDGYRQGVEIRSMKHFDAGTIKIHAGEPGHFVKQNTYGLNHIYYNNRSFVDSGGVDPTQFLGTTSTANRRVSARPFICVPPLELDSLAYDKLLYDGVIDFLGARRRSEFLSTDMPFEPFGVRGEIQNGNNNGISGCDLVVTIFESLTSSISQRPFNDDPTLLDKRWPKNQRKVLNQAILTPFNDLRLVRNCISSSNPYNSSMTSALSLMTGSTENYISSKQRSSTSGWVYNNNETIGTDSIAFGGMTY